MFFNQRSSQSSLNCLLVEDSECVTQSRFLVQKAKSQAQESGVML